MIEVTKAVGYEEQHWTVAIGNGSVDVSESDIKDLIGTLQATIHNYKWEQYAKRHEGD